LFPNRQQRKPRIVLEEEDLNAEIEKIIGHESLRNGGMRFLCEWEGFSTEDATYRKADSFKDSPIGIQLVKDYITGFKDRGLPSELEAWKSRTDWISEIYKEDKSSFNEERGGCRDQNLAEEFSEGDAQIAPVGRSRIRKHSRKRMHRPPLSGGPVSI